MYAYEKPIQRRVINGTITRSAVAPDGAGHKLVLQGNSSPTTIPLLNLYSGSGANRKGLLREEGFLTQDPIRAHLIKCAWDGGNNSERITQWRRDQEEVSWTSIEGNVQTRAAAYPANAVIPVKTITDDPNLGNTLLGADRAAFNTAHTSANISAKQYSDAKEELNRQITTARMELKRQDEETWDNIGSLNCPICTDIELNTALG